MTAADLILDRLAEHADEAFTHHEELKARAAGEVTLAELSYAEGWRHGAAVAHTLATLAALTALTAETELDAGLSLGASLERDHARHRTPASDLEEDR